MSRLANHRENDGTDSRPIVFVVHSLGGLVCENVSVLSDSWSHDIVADVDSD